MGNAPSSGNVHTTRFLAGCPEIPPTPAGSDVRTQFDELLRAKQIPTSVAQELSTLESLVTKWMYVFLSNLPAESVAKDWLEPRECVLQVVNVQQHIESIHELFCAIRINAILRSCEWVNKFIAADGVGALVTLLQSTSVPVNPVVLDEAVNVLITLAAFSDGLVEMTEANGCCTGLLTALETSTTVASKVRTLKLLELMCSHSKSTQEIVLSAVISTAAPEERPFRSICQLSTAHASEPVLQAAVVVFLNGLLGSITNSAHRIAIRDDLIFHGFVSTLEAYRVKAETSAELRSAVELFLTAHQTDLSSKGEDDPVLAEVPSTWTVTITPAAASDEVPEATEGREVSNEEPAQEFQVSTAQSHDEAQFSSPNAEPSGVPESKEDGEVKETAQESGNQDEGVTNEQSASDTSAIIPSTHSGQTSDLQSSPEQTSPQQSSMLQTLISQLESQQMDDATSQKIARVLQTLVESMSTEKAKGMEVVDRLEKSLTARSNQPDEQSEATTASSSGEDADSGVPLQRVRMRLLSGFGDNGPSSSSAAASPGRSSVSKSASIFQSFENFFSGSAAPTPAKPQTASAQDCVSSSEPSGGSCGSPMVESEDDGSRKSAVPKLTLPFFQSFRKGPGLGVTPASTPIATASVRKDAKRHSFSSFASPPLPTMAEGGLTLPGGGGGASALPSLSLIPLLPAIEKPSLTVYVPNRLEQPSEDVTAAAPPVTGTDVSKFRKLLSMGAPREAVRAKMCQAGLDPDLLDEKLGFDAPSPRSVASSTSQPPPAPIVSDANLVESGTTSNTISSGPDISKFRKLLSMGAPLAAVKAKMVQAGLDSSLLDQKVGFSEPVPAPAAPTVAGPEPKPDEVSDSAVQGPDISKFKKLLTMGAPLAVVKAKMMQAGLDPALLDGPAPAAVTPPVAAKVLVKDDLEYAKFFKLQSMGAPAAAVKAKMRQAGLNSDLLDTPDAEMPGKGASSQGAPVKKPVVLVKEDPEYVKFFKLLSMGAPAPTVKAKMQMAGLKPELLDTPDAVLSGPEDDITATPAAIPLVLVKDDPEYAKFFKLLSMGAPAPTVKAKMQMAGLKPELLDTPDAPLNLPAAADAAQRPHVLVKDDPEYAKFFKLLTMGAPAETVKAKMQMAGLKPELLDTPDAPLNPQVESKPAVLVKDDPEYAKFFKLLTMGAPPPTVKAKMQMAGLRPELLDTPDAVLTPATKATPATEAAKAAVTANRRAHLAISIKPPVKQTTRSFYWQQLKGEAIKGTIWEEIDKESSELSNQVPLVLSACELAVLEAEFPPPQAANGPGTAGARGRTNSVDQTANGGPPGSPMGSPRVVFLIDRSRANNISIIIKQFRMSNAALREAIMKLDANVLTIERVQGLLKIMPTEEEIAAITGFQGDPLTLNEAERILKELISVPRLKQRLSALQAKLQFPTLVRDLQTKVTKLRTASTEISQSTEFKTTLLVVLQVGNKMNQGTNRGDAKGFRLGDLTKLAQLKSVDKAVTLLHFVARMIRLKKGNLVRLGDALSSLYDVQNIPIPELQADMFKITEVIDNVGNELSAQKLKNSIEEKESCDLFVKVMDEFMDTASTTTATLKDELDSTMQLLKDTMKRFDKDTDADDTQAPESSGPPTAASMAGACEFFSIVYEFSVALTKADRENELRRLKEERQLKLQQQKSQLPTRSHSSVDLLAGRSKIGKDNEVAGPETPEKSLSKKDSSSRMAGKGSIFGTASVTRSASMSAILEPVIQSVSAAAVPSAKTVKTPERPPVAEKSKLKKLAVAATTVPADSSLSKPPHPTSRAGKRTEEAGSKASKPQVKKDDKSAKEKPKSKAKTMMAVPGKIIKATKHGSNVVSPLKIVPSALQAAKSPVKSTENSDSPGSGPLSSLKKMANSSIEKSKRCASSGERIVPFDGAVSLEDIRSKLERKHSLPDASDQSSKPETESEAEDLHDNNNSRPASEQEDTLELEAFSALRPSVQTVLLFTGYSERASFLSAILTNADHQQPPVVPHRRRLTSSSSDLSVFRAVQKKGMRGFLEGGTFLNSSPTACASQCAADTLCLSFDYETVTLACYISYTDRYAHPEVFLDFPTGVYYEWQGVIAVPELEPNGGLYSTQIAVRLFINKLAAVIYYRVEALDVAATLTVSSAALFGPTQKFGVARNGDLIILPPYSCRIYAMAVKEGMTNSEVLVSNDYSIHASKYAFLLPYFNSDFHGRVVRLKLDVKGKKRPRPARFLEFSDYESEMGIGPYSGQISVVNLTTLNPDFKGFYGGLTGFAQTEFINETYSVPADDDPNYKVLKWRLVFGAQYQPHPSHVGTGSPARVVQDAEYLYLAPYYSGVSYLGMVIRILTLTFADTPFIEQLNLTKISSDLKGFGSAFTDAKFAYFVPLENESGLFGKLVRINMNDFTTKGVTVLDLAAINPRFVGFSWAFAYNNFAYLVPFLKPLTFEEKTTNLREFPVDNSGLVVRVNLQTFATADSLDLSNVHPGLVGFSGAVRVANYAYFIPYMRRRVASSTELNAYSSLVARVDLRDFTSVAHVDLAKVDDDLRGFMRGFAYKQFVIFVPWRSKYYSPDTKAQSGKVARLDTTKFSSEGVTFLDLATAYRSQVPDRPDDSLRGFRGGFVSGKYGFFVPFFDGGLFSGKVCRINLEKFDEVQVLDLTALDQDLRGYAGGIVSRTQETLDTDMFGEFQMRQGTTTPYEYIY